MSLKERLCDKIKIVPGPLNTPCHEWVGATAGRGYGQICIEGSNYLAHRVAYELFVEPIPEGLLVMHMCDNPPCINPKHLFLGTHKDNVADMIRKGRDRYGEMDGEQCGHAILTKRKAAEIKFLALEGWLTQREIAHHYDISYAQVCRIKQGKRWLHVTPIEPEWTKPTTPAVSIRRV